MLKLDNSLLEELGLGSLPEDQKKAMLQHIYETLELRVGTNLANQMTDQQLEEFEKFIDDGGDANQAQALQWLEANLPNYKQVVNQVFEELKAEVKNMANQIMATSGMQPPAPQPQQTAMPEPMVPGQPMQSVNQGYAPAPLQQDAYAPAVQQPQVPQYGAPQPAGPAPQPYQPQAFGAQPMQPAVMPQYDPMSQQQPGAPMQQPYQPPVSPQPQYGPAPTPGQQTPDGAAGYQYPQQQPPAGPGYQQ